VNFRNAIVIETEKGIQETIQVTNLTRADRYSNGSLRIDTDGDGAIIRAYKEVVKEA
jgi:topoisomerase IV subunit A